jgi:teichoic acid transport system permease protein
MNLADYAKSHGLRQVGLRPSFINYLKEVWLRRDFAFTMSLYAAEAANARTRLGKWWLILLPSLQAFAYGLVFGLILGDLRPENFIPFLITGVFLFSFFSSSFSSGAKAITSNTGLLRTLSFPRILLPLSAVIRQFINFLPQLALLPLVMIIFGQDITWDWLYLIPIALLMFVFSTGLAMISARLTVQVKDLGKLVPFITRLMFYLSGIFFEIDRIFANYPEVLAAARLNPVYDFISLARGALVNGMEMTPYLWGISAAWAFGIFFFGVFYFWKAEARYGRD